jgi:ribonucleotide monophosphatase NagD (HAD superfamily)
VRDTLAALLYPVVIVAGQPGAEWHCVCVRGHMLVRQAVKLVLKGAKLIATNPDLTGSRMPCMRGEGGKGALPVVFICQHRDVPTLPPSPLFPALPTITTDHPTVAPSAPAEFGIVPATGSLAAPIELSTGRKAYFVGKPNPLIMRHAMLKLGESRC